MKNPHVSSATTTFPLIIVLLFLISVSVKAQNTIRLITPGVVAQGQSFTGTIVEETPDGPIPLKAGSEISIMGEVVAVGKEGKVKVPACEKATGRYLIPASVISITGATALMSNQTVSSSPVNSIPFPEGETPVTSIWNTSDLIGPGKVITVEGTNMQALTEEVLISNSGKKVSLTEIASSFFEADYVIANADDFQEGEYHFSAEDEFGDIHISENVSLYPTFSMSGPPLKHVGQKGKIKIQTNGDGVITLSGGPPVIELHPTADVNVFNSDIGTTFTFPSHAGDAMVIPFTALEVGQYTVTADIHSEFDLPDEFASGDATVTTHPVQTEYDPVTDETIVNTFVEITDADGSPVANTPVEGIFSNPVRPEPISAITDGNGMVSVSTSIPGNVDGKDISINILGVLGFTLPVIAVGVNEVLCGNQDGDKGGIGMSDEMREMYEDYKATWCNYQGICGTALMEIARNHPEAYADFLEAEQQIEDALNGKNEEDGNDNDSEEASNLDEEMRKIYEANKKRWGNYQGICGTALMEMARLYPDLYQDFLDNEKRIEDILKGNENQDNNDSDEEAEDQSQNESDEMGDLDEGMLDIYKENKKKWGNYAGICGTALMEMARMYPDLYQDFLDNEKRIEDMINGNEDQDDNDSDEETADQSRSDSDELGDLDEGMLDIYKENKKKWGNYAGICGTALMEMARMYPDLYQDFLDNEQRIQDMINNRNNQDENGSSNEDESRGDGTREDSTAPGGLDDLPEDLQKSIAEMYESNKRKWGNYAGICGTGLMDIARNFPELYEEIVENERQIEKWLNDRLNNSGNSDTDDDGVDDPVEKTIPIRPGDIPNYGNQDNSAETKSESKGNDSHSDESDNSSVEEGRIVNPDAPEIENEVARRAFESDDVEVFHTITIRLGGREAGITKLGDEYIMTEEKSIAIDPETNTAVSFFDFDKGYKIDGELWYAIYLISLGHNPVNLISRIVDSSEELGREYLDGLINKMKEDKAPSLVVEVTSEMLILMHLTASFEMAAMPQLGDHVRSAFEHFEKAQTAAENGDWFEAWIELNRAESDMALLALELWPGGSGGKGVAKGGKSVLKPSVEMASDVGRNLDEVVDVLRTAARNETSQDIATAISRKADEIEAVADQSNTIRRAFDIGTARPSNFATAAKDRRALESFFGAENVSTVGRRNPDNVLVITATTADGKQVKQVWVRPEYSDYKKAYQDVHGELPTGTDLDHLQSRTRASQQGYGYVQVTPVNSDVNQAWGRTMEKRTVNMGNAGHIEPAGTPDIRKIDQFQWWKIQGISPDDVKKRVAAAMGK